MVVKYVCLVPKKLRQVDISIETLLDMSTLTVDDISSRLKAAKNQDLDIPEEISGGTLLLIEQGCTRSNEKQAGEGNAKAKPKNQWCGKSGKKGGSAKVESKDVSHPNNSRNKCHNCGRQDNGAKDCRSAKRE